MFRHFVVAGCLLAFPATSAVAQCDIEGIGTPFSQDPYDLFEWEGHYYDAGWFHLRWRPVEGGEWTSPGGGISGGGGYTLAGTMLEWDDRLIIGGAFFSAGGVIAANVVAWDGVQYEALGSGLNGEVLAMTVWNDTLVAGGDFTAAGDGSPSLSHVAFFDAEANEWFPLGQGFTSFPPGYSTWRVGGLCVHDGDLYATGRFLQSGATTLNGVARYDETSGNWMPMGTGIPGMSSGNTGTTIASYDGKVWVSGWFQSIGGISAPWMATWDGETWAPVPTGPSRHCLKLHVFGGELYGAGPFPFTIQGVEHDIARFDGTMWHGMGSSDINWPSTLQTTADGQGLLTCGNFTTFDGVATGSLVRLECDVECEGDLDGDGAVGVGDLIVMLGAWGPCGICSSDLDGDGSVGASDLLVLLAAWGGC